MNYENVKAHIQPKSAGKSVTVWSTVLSTYHLKDTILLQIGTQFVPICNKK